MTAGYACKLLSMRMILQYKLDTNHLIVASLNLKSLLLSKLYTNVPLHGPAAKRHLLCQHERQALCIYLCLMSINAQQIHSLSWQHNYIIPFLVAVLAVQVCTCVFVFVYIFCFTELDSTLTNRCSCRSPCPLTPDEPETSARG